MSQVRQTDDEHRSRLVAIWAAVALVLFLLLGAIIVISVGLSSSGSSRDRPAGVGTSAAPAGDGTVQELADAATAATPVDIEVDVTDDPDYCSLRVSVPENALVTDWTTIVSALRTEAQRGGADCYVDLYEVTKNWRAPSAGVSTTTLDLLGYEPDDIDDIVHTTYDGDFTAFIDLTYDGATEPRFTLRGTIDAAATPSQVLDQISADAVAAEQDIDRDDAIVSLRYDAGGEDSYRSIDVSFTRGELATSLRGLSVGLRFEQEAPDPVSTLSSYAHADIAWGYVHINNRDGEYLEWDSLSAAEQKAYTDLISRWNPVLTAADVSVFVFGNTDLN